MKKCVLGNSNAMDKKDPWFNSFKATVAAFSAGIGGAEAITVIPFSLSDEIESTLVELNEIHEKMNIHLR